MLQLKTTKVIISCKVVLNYNKVIFFILFIVTLSVGQTCGMFFSLGPGYNNGNIHKWIQTYQMGSNFGLELGFKNILFKAAFNPETSEGEKTTKPFDINGITWPAHIQVNFMAFQYLVGYQFEINKFQCIPFIGISQSWITVPYRYEETYVIFEGKPDVIKYVTGFSYGPMFQLTNRYILENYDLLANLKAIPYVNIDIGYIKPLFNKFVDNNLTGDHIIIKIGFGGYIAKNK